MSDGIGPLSSSCQAYLGCGRGWWLWVDPVGGGGAGRSRCLGCCLAMAPALALLTKSAGACATSDGSSEGKDGRGNSSEFSGGVQYV